MNHNNKRSLEEDSSPSSSDNESYPPRKESKKQTDIMNTIFIIGSFSSIHLYDLKKLVLRILFYLVKYHSKDVRLFISTISDETLDEKSIMDEMKTQVLSISHRDPSPDTEELAKGYSLIGPNILSYSDGTRFSAHEEKLIFIGFDNVSGGAARYFRDSYTESKFVLFNWIWPDSFLDGLELETYKKDHESIICQSDFVFSIGPNLHKNIYNRYQDIVKCRHNTFDIPFDQTLGLDRNTGKYNEDDSKVNIFCIVQTPEEREFMHLLQRKIKQKIPTDWIVYDPIHNPIPSDFLDKIRKNNSLCLFAHVDDMFSIHVLDTLSVGVPLLLNYNNDTNKSLFFNNIVLPEIKSIDMSFDIQTWTKRVSYMISNLKECYNMQSIRKSIPYSRFYTGDKCQIKCFIETLRKLFIIKKKVNLI